MCAMAENTQYMPTRVYVHPRNQGTHEIPEKIRKKKKPASLYLSCSSIKCIPKPFAHCPKTLPSHRLVLVGHQLHNPSLQASPFELSASLGKLLHQMANVVAGNGQYLLIVLPVLGKYLRQLLGQCTVAFVQDAAGIFLPESRVLMRGRPAQVARLDFSGVLIESGLGLCVFIQHGRKSVKVFEEVGIRQVTTSEVGQESWESDKYSNGQEGRPVANAQVVESGEQKSGRLFFR